MRQTIDDLAQPGFLPDPPPHITPGGAWTDSRNVRYRDGALEKVRGYESVLGTLSATAVWAEPLSDGTNYYWAYATGGGGHGGFGSGDVLYATDGTTHSDISHPSITFSANLDLGWSGGGFHGFLVATDGSNIPVQWTPGLGNNASSLSYWPAITCKVIRFYKDFIWALRITDGGNYNPRVLRWSDRAAQSALPTSWDYTDPTNQAGIVELAQTQDAIVDALPLRDSMMVYKEQHTWIADYVGGLDVMGFRQVFSETGLLTERCAVAIGARHVVLSDNDLIVHDGSSARSIADRRTRRWLFNRISSTAYRRSFLATNIQSREVYVCFPESGQDYPNLALVWNYAEDTFHVQELGGQKTYGSHGIIAGTNTTFDAESGAFDVATGVFDEVTYNAFQDRLVMLSATSTKAYQFETGETFDGQTMQCYADRTATGITQDLGYSKRVWRIWPRVVANAGLELRFWVAMRENLNEAPSYTGPYRWTAGTDTWIDLRLSGRVMDVRVEYSGIETFRIHGFNVDFAQDGFR